MGLPIIAFEEVAKSFGSQQVLDRLSLAFEKEKTHVLLGSSGCGKSTILRLILGLTQPDVGTVNLDSSISEKEHIGYVVQDGGLFPHLTARENVSLIASLRGWDKQRISSRIEELTDLVGLNASLIKKYPKKLSGGQKQRVSLMRALIMDPPLLLLDEPLGALDPIIRSDLQEQLQSIFRKLKKTVIFVTHDLQEAAYLGDTIALLNDGRIEQRGDFRSLLDSPATPFVRKFLDAQRLLETK